MQYGFYFDQTRCTGCGTCIVACKDWHDLPAGPESWLRVTTLEKGNRQNLFVARIVSLCYHCTQPACLAVCPTGAIAKRPEDGIVVVDAERCLGGEACGRCQEACPYGVPQFPSGTNGAMRKCDLCLERWSQQQKPVCVMACPMRALDAGPLEVLRETYGGKETAVGFTRAPELGPSILFKPKPDPRTHAAEPLRTSTIPFPPGQASSDRR